MLVMVAATATEVDSYPDSSFVQQKKPIKKVPKKIRKPITTDSVKSADKNAQQTK